MGSNFVFFRLFDDSLLVFCFELFYVSFVLLFMSPCVQFWFPCVPLIHSPLLLQPTIFISTWTLFTQTQLQTLFSSVPVYLICQYSHRYHVSIIGFIPHPVILVFLVPFLTPQVSYHNPLYELILYTAFCFSFENEVEYFLSSLWPSALSKPLVNHNTNH